MATESEAQKLQSAAIASAKEYETKLKEFVAELKTFAKADTVKSSVGFADQQAAFYGAAVKGVTGMGDIGMGALQKLIGSDGVAATLKNIPEAPTIAVPVFNTPTPPANFPEFESQAVPVLGMAPAPSISVSSFAGATPMVREPVFPPTPDLKFPEEYSLENIVLPEIGRLEIPEFLAVAPEDELLLPTDKFDFTPAEYTSDLFDVWKEQVASELTQGGYGILEDDERRIFERERGRQLQLGATNAAIAARDMAKRGFALPPGALIAQNNAARQEAIEKLSASSSALAIKRAEMFVEHRRFTLSQVEKIEERSLKVHMYVQEQALNLAKYAVEAAIKMFEVRVARFNAFGEGFKNAISEYQTRLQAELAKSEDTKLMLQATVTQVDIQKNRVALHAAQLEGVRARAAIYGTQVDTARTIFEVEGIKLGLFNSQITAYAEGIKAETVKMTQYELVTRAEATKASTYKTLVDAQVAKAEFAKAAAVAKSAEAEILTQNAKIKLASIETTASLYKLKVDSTVAANHAILGAYSIRTEAFRASAAAQEAVGRLGVAGYEATAKVGIENIRLALEQQKGLWDLRMKATEVGAETTVKGMQAQLGQVIAIATSST